VVTTYCKLVAVAEHIRKTSGSASLRATENGSRDRFLGNIQSVFDEYAPEYNQVVIEILMTSKSVKLLRITIRIQNLKCEYAEAK
jgi:hypothetical protein